MQMKRIVQEYLESPKERRDATYAEMVQRPDEAFDALLASRGPYPGHQYPIDVFPDYLAPLLTDLLRQYPRLLLERDVSSMSSGERWIVTAAAIDAERPELAGVILGRLQDRSVDVKFLVVDAISRCAFLRLPGARPQLEKLLSLKSIAYYRDHIQRALDSLATNPVA